MYRPAILIVALSLLGCGASDDGGLTGKLTVAASIPPHAWLVGRIGGDSVVVYTVLRPGESPTTHQPSDSQVSRVLSGRAFFRCGVPFESGAWFRALEGQIEIVDLQRGISTRKMEAHTHGGDPHPGNAHESHSATDPHTWLSPKRLVVQARLVSETLKRIDPVHAAGYAERMAALVTELEELDRSIATTLARHRGRSFLVFHPSWGYFADDYGLRQIAIEIEGKQPSDAELTSIQDRARSLGIGAVFVQPQIAGQAARAVAEAIDVELVTLDPLAAEIPANLRRSASLLAESLDG
jgi:zinc transport system substrate-binding protein